MAIRPLYDRIIVKRTDAERSTASGIVIPDSAGEKPEQGQVLAVGPGKLLASGELRPLAVKAGDIVTKDQLVAYMGSTGRSTGTHLHYEVLRNGKHIDPSSVLTLAKR